MLTNILLTIVLVLIIGGAARYIYKEKKRGTKCIGCPAANGACPKCKKH